MNQKSKETAILLATIFGGSILVGAVTTLLDMDIAVTVTAAIVWIAVVLGVHTARRMKSGRASVARMREINQLFAEGDLEGYIAALRELLETEEEFQARQVLHLNLAVAYCELQDYENALQALQGISQPRRLDAGSAAFYWVNLALCNFYLDRDEAGMAVVNQQRKAFAQMRKAEKPAYGPALIEVFELACQGEKEDAAALLEVARAQFETEQTAHVFALAAKKCGAAD